MYVKYRSEQMLDTAKQRAPAVQIVPGLIRYTWLVPQELLKLVRSNTQLYVLPNHVQRWYWVAQYHLCTGFGNTYTYVIEGSSEYTVGVPQNSTKGGGLYAYNIFSNAAHVLRVLLQLLCKFLANIAIYYTILTILQVYISSFTQF